MSTSTTLFLEPTCPYCRARSEVRADFRFPAGEGGWHGGDGWSVHETSAPRVPDHGAPHRSFSGEAHLECARCGSPYRFVVTIEPVPATPLRAAATR